MKDLIIKFNTNNSFEDSGAQFFVIERTEECFQRYMRMHEAAKLAAETTATGMLYSVSFWDDFRALDATFEEAIEGDTEGAILYDISDEEEEEYNCLDDRMENHTLKMSPGGGMLWVAWGKYCGTEYWTDEINIKDLMEGKFKHGKRKETAAVS